MYYSTISSKPYSPHHLHLGLNQTPNEKEKTERKQTMELLQQKYIYN